MRRFDAILLFLVIVLFLGGTFVLLSGIQDKVVACVKAGGAPLECKAAIN